MKRHPFTRQIANRYRYIRRNQLELRRLTKTEQKLIRSKEITRNSKDSVVKLELIRQDLEIIESQKLWYKRIIELDKPNFPF